MTQNERELKAALEVVAAALRGLRYGTVQITVHDALVVQVERIERHRLRFGADGSGDGVAGTTQRRI